MVREDNVVSREGLTKVSVFLRVLPSWGLTHVQIYFFTAWAEVSPIVIKTELKWFARASGQTEVISVSLIPPFLDMSKLPFSWAFKNHNEGVQMALLISVCFGSRLPRFDRGWEQYYLTSYANAWWGRSSKAMFITLDSSFREWFWFSLGSSTEVSIMVCYRHNP